MRSTGRKLLTAGLVALYGGISLLGYGLHELAPAHHHALPAYLADSCHHHDHADRTHHDQHATGQPFAAGLCDAHECDICVFLAQIRSERPLVTVPVIWQPCVAGAIITLPAATSQATLGLPVPRGPPALVG